MQVAGEVRDGQTIAFYQYETGLAAAMGNVDRTLAIDIHIAGDKEGVCLGDHAFGRVIQPGEMLRDTRRGVSQRHRMKLPQLNVLRAIAKGLIDCHAEASRGHGLDVPIDAVAPPGV